MMLREREKEKARRYAGLCPKMNGMTARNPCLHCFAHAAERMFDACGPLGPVVTSNDTR